MKRGFVVGDLPNDINIVMLKSIILFFFLNFLFSFFLGSLDLFSTDGKEIVIMLLKKLWLSFFIVFGI